jgi:MoaA/NifB/PqqE/SkfB family radical SAM enzyme
MKRRTVVKGAARLGLALMRGGNSWVSVVYLATMRCNARCPYCDFPRVPFEELDTGGALALIRALKEAGTVRLSISGGEPLLRADLGAMTMEAGRCGFITSVVTNGTLLQDRLEDLRPVDYILCTMEGGEGVHERMRGAGSWGMTVRGLEMLKRSGIGRLGIICPLHRENLAEIEEPLRLAEQLGTKAFFQPVQRRNGWTGPEFHGMLSPEEMKHAFGRLLRLKITGRAVGNSRRYLEIMAGGGDAGSFPKCTSGRFAVTLLPDGRVTPCCMLPFQASPVRVDPRTIGRAVREAAVPACEGCTISPYMESNLILNLDLGALLNALMW